MAARYAVQSCVVFVTALGHDDWLTLGCLRDSASAVVTQAPGLFTSTAPTVANWAGPLPLFGYLAVNPAGP